MDYTNEDVDCMTRTLYGEARGEYARYGLCALMAVASVIRNRWHKQTWFGKTVGQVCRKPLQFSCWNDGDPNRRLIERLQVDDAMYRRCWGVSHHILQDIWPDVTGGADHYYSVSARVAPSWVRSMMQTVEIGRHRFYLSQGPLGPKDQTIFV